MITWYTGLDNYRKHTLDNNVFTLELRDVELRNFQTVSEAYAAHLEGANLPVEVMYSGGLDSECVLAACLQNNIPAIAVTMRLIYRGAPFNMSDLYYSEKFCNNNGIKQVFVDLDVEKFIDNGVYAQYMESYSVDCMSSIVLWFFDQCHTFPVAGGDYSWPQTNIGKKVYSPHNYGFNCQELFLKDRGISGIGNMMGYSLDSNCIFIKEHLKTFDNSTSYKTQMMRNLGFNLEPRHRSQGWELATIVGYDFKKIFEDIDIQYTKTKSVVVWGDTLAKLVDGNPGSNEFFG